MIHGQQWTVSWPKAKWKLGLCTDVWTTVSRVTKTTTIFWFRSTKTLYNLPTSLVTSRWGHPLFVRDTHWSKKEHKILNAPTLHGKNNFNYCEHASNLIDLIRLLQSAKSTEPPHWMVGKWLSTKMMRLVSKKMRVLLFEEARQWLYLSRKLQLSDCAAKQYQDLRSRAMASWHSFWQLCSSSVRPWIHTVVNIWLKREKQKSLSGTKVNGKRNQIRQCKHL